MARKPQGNEEMIRLRIENANLKFQLNSIRAILNHAKDYKEVDQITIITKENKELEPLVRKSKPTSTSSNPQPNRNIEKETFQTTERNKEREPPHTKQIVKETSCVECGKEVKDGKIKDNQCYECIEKNFEKMFDKSEFIEAAKETPIPIPPIIEKTVEVSKKEVIVDQEGFDEELKNTLKEGKKPSEVAREMKEKRKQKVSQITQEIKEVEKSIGGKCKSCGTTENVGFWYKAQEHYCENCAKNTLAMKY